MLQWLAGNIGTILVGLLVAGIVVFDIVKIARDRKKGKTSCGCGCANCAMKGACHQNSTNQSKAKQSS